MESEALVAAVAFAVRAAPPEIRPVATGVGAAAARPAVFYMSFPAVIMATNTSTAAEAFTHSSRGMVN